MSPAAPVIVHPTGTTLCERLSILSPRPALPEPVTAPVPVMLVILSATIPCPPELLIWMSVIPAMCAPAKLKMPIVAEVVSCPSKIEGRVASPEPTNTGTAPSDHVQVARKLQLPAWRTDSDRCTDTAACPTTMEK